jgi:pantetheine-phosphate adenylyltransferase
MCGAICNYNYSKDTSDCPNCEWGIKEGDATSRKAVYAGSFDPFTNGHLYIIEEASKMFDRVYVLIAHNANKTRHSDVEEMARAITMTLYHRGLFNVCVIVHKGFVADFCLAHDVEYLIRGLRNTSDYLYEENIAKINHEINPDLKTIYYRANNDVISSSLIREMLTYGKDVSEYVPETVLPLIQK